MGLSLRRLRMDRAGLAVSLYRQPKRPSLNAFDWTRRLARQIVTLWRAGPLLTILMLLTLALRLHLVFCSRSLPKS